MEAVDLPLIIEALGYNTENMEINKNHDIWFNIMKETFFRERMKNDEGVGSVFEGIDFITCGRTSRANPDKDIAGNYSEITLSLARRLFPDCKKINVEHDLTTVPCPHFPGYVKVFYGHYILPNKLIHAANDNMFLSEEKFWKRNGPALSIYADSYENYKEDYVNCYAYKTWPVQANNWVRRNKPNNWPSKELIEKIKSKGYNLAPIGHDDCLDKENQHRIGIRGEKELVWSLNETQILCLVALRLILKEDIKLIDKEVLSSYHMKNLIFWCAEKESCEWTKKNFEICLKTCINKLIEFITFEKFPHYFIEDRNLINSKMTPNLKKQIGIALTKYNSDVLHVLSLESFDKLKKKTDNFKTTFLKCEKQISIIQMCIQFYLQSLIDFFIEHHRLFETHGGHNTVINLENAQSILSILENVKRHFNLPYIAYAKSMLGLLHYSRYYKTRCRNDKLKAGELLKSSVTLELVSLKFRFATFCFMENELKECLDICNDFFNKPSKYKTLLEKHQHFTEVFDDIMITIDCDKLYELTELKEKTLALFYDKGVSDRCGEGTLPQAKMYLLLMSLGKTAAENFDASINIISQPEIDLSQVIALSGKGEVEVNNILLELKYHYKTSFDKLLLILKNLPNLLFCDMSFNVPYLASEKWAVPEVFQYELLSVTRCHPESKVFGIYIDPMLNCLVLSFLCCHEANMLTQRNEMLSKMALYINEYPDSGQPIDADLPHSLSLYRVYNIIAFCFIKAGCYKQALNYILKSLDINGNAENVAYGYFMCVRLYVKEYIILTGMSLQDVHGGSRTTPPDIFPGTIPP